MLQLVLGLALSLSRVGPAGADAPQAEPTPSPAVTIVHEDGATTLTLPNAQISLSNRIQFRFTDEFPPDTVQLSGTTEAGQPQPSFAIRRAKTTLEGWFWRKELTFEIELSWAAPEPGTQWTPLEDALLTWDVGGKDAFRVTIGQFKVPFGRQLMTSSGKLQFADRSMVNDEFTLGRDVGIQLSGRLAGSRIEYFAGVFNGNPPTRPGNDNAKLQYNARVAFEPFGRVSYSEAAFEGWDKPLLSIAGQVENNDLAGSEGLPDFTELDVTVLGADLMFKYHGFSLFAEYFGRERSARGGPASPSASSHSDGYNIEAGYFLKRDRVEIAARVGAYDPSDRIPSDDQHETGGALNYFFLKHRLKLVADFRALRDDLAEETTKELRIQAQFVF